MNIHLAGSALERVTEVPDPLRGGPTAFLVIQPNHFLLFTSSFGQASLNRAVPPLQVRFYSLLIPFGVFATLPHQLAVYFLSLVVVFCSPQAGLNHSQRNTKSKIRCTRIQRQNEAYCCSNPTQSRSSTKMIVSFASLSGYRICLPDITRIQNGNTTGTKY